MQHPAARRVQANPRAAASGKSSLNYSRLPLSSAAAAVTVRRHPNIVGQPVLPHSLSGQSKHAFAPALDAPAVAPSRRATGRGGFIARHSVVVSALLWLSLLTIYQLDDSVVEEGDAIANVELPITLLRTGTLHFTPRLSPIVFLWKSTAPLAERTDYYVRSWHERHEGKAAGYWYATGHLRLNGARYFVIKSPIREAYVCTFGVIAGLSMTPLAAALAAFHPDFLRSEHLKLSAAKLHASALIALSALLLFWLGRRFVPPRYALLVALAYGLGTCVWAVSSHTLWQQTVNVALLSGVAYAFIRIALDDSKRARIVCGLLLGAALASRPTAVFFAIAIAIYLWRERREALRSLLLSTLVIPLAVAVYDQYYFGSPINFAQELVGHQVALQKTGIEWIWQTPMIVGLSGLLLSPSRGLLVFSPFMLAAFFGAQRVWIDPKYASLRPLTLAAGATMLLQCKWFDWWGGWTFGYRPWLEAVPVLALCLLPVIEAIFRARVLSGLFCAALAWSVFVQGLGALAYDKYWNARDLHRVVKGEETAFFTSEPEALRYATATGGQYTGLFSCNIDLPACRYRLWSLDDNIISFYWGERYAVSRANRTSSSFNQFLTRR
jgi:hypothetical protein